MRPFKWILALVLTLLPALALAQDLGPMRLSLIEGGVQVMSQDTASVWEAAEINTPLGAGDRIWTPESGRVEVRVRGDVYVRADGNSSLDVLRSSRDSVQFYAEAGHIYANNRRGGIRVVQIDTPLTSVRGYDNSVFLLDVDDGITVVQVLKGEVYAENRLGQTRIAPGDALTIREDGYSEFSPIGPQDEWDIWNIDRDRMLTAWGRSSRHLPNELQEYSSDLDNYGSWAWDYDYGYVWFPYVSAVDWAPYRDGRWRWAGGRYVWVSFEPWGWAPFHFGRWFFRPGRGWCWVPPAAGGVFWAPGYVGWVRTGDTIGWVPLAPGEVYYGYGNFGPHSVNVIDIDITTIHQERFRNAEFPHGETFVRREDFGSRERRFVEPQKAPVGRRFDFRPPRTEPGRGVIMRQEAPIGQRPPERVINLKPEKLREERPLIREREQSVFRPQEPRPLAPARVKEPKAISRGFERQKEKKEQKEKRQEDKKEQKERRQQEKQDR